MLLQEVEADFVGSFFPRGYTLWKRIKGITRWINLAAIDPRSTRVMNPSRRTNESGRFLSSVSYATGCVLFRNTNRPACGRSENNLRAARREYFCRWQKALSSRVYTRTHTHSYIYRCIHVRKTIFFPISKRVRSSQTYFIYFSKLTPAQFY